MSESVREGGREGGGQKVTSQHNGDGGLQLRILLK